MEGVGYWTGMLTGFSDGPSLQDFNFGMTQETQDVESFEVQAGADVETFKVQAAAGTARGSGSRPNNKRQKNFKPKKDEIVVSAWLNVSRDPITGANQSGASFWRRIYKFYETHRHPHPSRTESSIMHRWLYILENVNKFCACYEMVEGRNQCGTTIQDKVTEALTTFKGLYKEKTFSLMHCWNKLKDEDKWKAKRKELEEQKLAAKKKQKVHSNSTPTNVEDKDTDDDVAKIAQPDSSARKRSMGQKKAKEALRRGGGEACMEALDKMWAKKEAFDMEKEKKKEERYMASLAVEKERLQLEEKKVQAELDKIDLDRMEKKDKIMSMDISSLSPLQQQYYNHMQEKIVARRLSN